MKAILPFNPKNIRKNLKEVIVFITFFIFLHCFSYAIINIDFDSVTGVMKITTTSGENIVITKHPTTGGLAVNGT